MNEQTPTCWPWFYWPILGIGIAAWALLFHAIGALLYFILTLK